MPCLYEGATNRQIAYHGLIYRSRFSILYPYTIIGFFKPHDSFPEKLLCLPEKL